MKPIDQRVADALKRAVAFGPVSDKLKIEIIERTRHRYEKQQRYEESLRRRFLGEPPVARPRIYKKAWQNISPNGENNDVVDYGTNSESESTIHEFSEDLNVKLEFVRDAIIVTCVARDSSITFVLAASAVTNR